MEKRKSDILDLSSAIRTLWQGPGKRGNRTCEVLLHISGKATYRDLGKMSLLFQTVWVALGIQSRAADSAMDAALQENRNAVEATFSHIHSPGLARPLNPLNCSPQCLRCGGNVPPLTSKELSKSFKLIRRESGFGHYIK